MRKAVYRYDTTGHWDVPLDGSDDSERTWVVFFTDLDEQAARNAYQDLKHAFPNSVIIGCSSAGQFVDEAMDDMKLIAMVIHFEHTTIRCVHAQSKERGAEAAGQSLGLALAQDDLSGIFVLSNGVGVNGSDLTDGLNGVFQGRIPITGGLSADGDRFQSTWVMNADGEIDSTQVVAIGFYGERFRLRSGFKGGWDLFGPERFVTRAQGNVLFELDEQPALDLYKRYLGPDAVGLPASGLLFPLCIRRNDVGRCDLVRTILAVDEDNRSITFAGKVPQDSRVALMHANFDRLIDGAGIAAESIDASDYQGENAVGLMVSCVGRKLLLGGRIEEELEAVVDGLPPGVSSFGFYSYGELCPDEGGQAVLHNQVVKVALMWEANAETMA